MEHINLIIEPKRSGEVSKDYVYRMLRKNIIYNHLEPGDIISENMLTELFNVSRTPIREAVMRLVNDELLEVYPQKGTYVSLIDMNRVKEATFMREILEAGAARKACEVFGKDEIFQLETNLRQQIYYYENDKLIEVMELDNEFHKVIYENCGLLRVWKAMQGIASDQYRIRYLKLYDRFRWDETIEEHRGIIQDIIERDVDKVEKDIKCHISKIYDDSFIIQKKYSSYFKI